MRTARDRGTSVPQYPLVCVTPVQPLNQRGIHLRAKFGGGCFAGLAAWSLGLGTGCFGPGAVQCSLEMIRGRGQQWTLALALALSLHRASTSRCDAMA